MTYEELTIEQKRFVDRAKEGRNILVDACIGSGKTTAIQTLCDCMPGKRILYLTYNKLLKLDAMERIRNAMVRVTNYHGFGWQELKRVNIEVGVGDIIQTYNRKKPPCSNYDVLILDEYQDIEEEISYMLQHIKDSCPGIQIIAVGDMAQKIYDKTRLDVQKFIRDFLGTYNPMEFTQCFRLGKKHAAKLSRIWGKTIVGVNPDFEVRVMYEAEIRNTVKQLKPSQLLVLGGNYGNRTKLQNYLEKKKPDVFNKYTVWSKIAEKAESTSPSPDCAIFTTFDGCKGMEREVCVLYDWSSKYWQTRLMKPETRYEILRNIFCVAASRGKRLLIIANEDDQLTEEELMEPDCYTQYKDTIAVSEMFDYKYIEDVEAAYNCLEVREIQPVSDTIDVPISDGLIDLSFCIGTYQEALYFENYDIDNAIEFELSLPNRSFMRRDYQNYTLDQKILYLAMLETGQQRYCSQVKWPIVSEENAGKIRNRLSTHLPSTAEEQIPCQVPFSNDNEFLFNADGIIDTIHDNILYELKFVSVLSHVHVLQTAMYMAAKGYAVGRLWNIHTDQMMELTIPNVKAFLDKVAQATTKGILDGYRMDKDEWCSTFIHNHHDAYKDFVREASEKKTVTGSWVNNFFKERGLQLPVDAKSFVLFAKRNRRPGKTN